MIHILLALEIIFWPLDLFFVCFLGLLKHWHHLTCTSRVPLPSIRGEFSNISLRAKRISVGWHSSSSAPSGGHRWQQLNSSPFQCFYPDTAPFSATSCCVDSSSKYRYGTGWDIWGHSKGICCHVTKIVWADGTYFGRQYYPHPIIERPSTVYPFSWYVRNTVFFFCPFSVPFRLKVKMDVKMCEVCTAEIKISQVSVCCEKIISINVMLRAKTAETTKNKPYLGIRSYLLVSLLVETIALGIEECM